MKCECGSGSMTTDTRKIDLGVWRRRECKTCGTVFTTLEQLCITTANPYPTRAGELAAGGKVVAPPVPNSLPRPNPVRNRRKAAPGDDFKPAAFAPPPKPTHWNVGRVAAPPVDRVTETARDRIEDMKAARSTVEHGWDE